MGDASLKRMYLLWNRRKPLRRTTTLAMMVSGGVALGILVVGCANPGPPRPPSLRLPEPVSDLTARRLGDTVELRFTAPSRTTDKLPLRGATVSGALCRQVEHLPCATVGSRMNVPVTEGHTPVVWHDALPAELATGNATLLGYRVEFFNASGKSAGKSDAAYTFAGNGPAAVEGLSAEGSRMGVVLRWKAETSDHPADVLIERKDLTPKAAVAASVAISVSAPAKAKKGATGDAVWLVANGPEQTLDTTAVPDVSYEYSAVRRSFVTLGGRTLELRSAESAPVMFTLREVYAPPAPTGLTAAGFTQESAAFAVDLIWQPVDEGGLVTKLSGYNVYREVVEADGKATEARRRLNAVPVTVPAFHDATAKSDVRYRYSVTAVDAKGNESGAASSLLEPTAP